MTLFQEIAEGAQLERSNGLISRKRCLLGEEEKLLLFKELERKVLKG